jgi:hypothetical protein
MTNMETSRRPHGKMSHIFFLFLLSAVCFTTTVTEALAASVSPTTLSYGASSTSPIPPSQTVTFNKNSIVTKSWTASGNTAWMTISPSSGTISREKDQITVSVNASGLAAGTYNGTVNIVIGAQANAIPVTLVVSGATATSTSGTTTTSSGTTTSSPSIQLNPVSLSFSGTAGGANPFAQTFNISNPTGGTLTWTLTEPAAWLGLNISSGTTTTEVDGISANVSISGLAAGTYGTAITVTGSGATNSPKTIPVTLTLSAPATNGSASLTWDPSTDTSVAKYNLYMGTQPGMYGPPVSVGLTTNYTVGNLTSGKTYYFSVTAVNSAGTESQRSNEVNKIIQ